MRGSGFLDGLPPYNENCCVALSGPCLVDGDPFLLTF